MTNKELGEKLLLAVWEILKNDDRLIIVPLLDEGRKIGINDDKTLEIAKLLQNQGYINIRGESLTISITEAGKRYITRLNS